MSLLDWLRRLGILRFGTEAGVYHNAVERPLSLQMGDVFNPDKDVINLSPSVKRKSPPPPEDGPSDEPD